MGTTNSQQSVTKFIWAEPPGSCGGHFCSSLCWPVLLIYPISLIIVAVLRFRNKPHDCYIGITSLVSILGLLACNAVRAKMKPLFRMRYIFVCLISVTQWIRPVFRRMFARYDYLQEIRLDRHIPLSSTSLPCSLTLGNDQEWVKLSFVV